MEDDPLAGTASAKAVTVEDVEPETPRQPKRRPTELSVCTTSTAPTLVQKKQSKNSSQLIVSDDHPIQVTGPSDDVQREGLPVGYSAQAPLRRAVSAD